MVYRNYNDDKKTTFETWLEGSGKKDIHWIVSKEPHELEEFFKYWNSTFIHCECIYVPTAKLQNSAKQKGVTHTIETVNARLTIKKEEHLTDEQKELKKQKEANEAMQMQLAEMQKQMSEMQNKKS